MKGSTIASCICLASLLFALGSAKIITPEERWRHSAGIKPTSSGPDRAYEVVQRTRDSFRNAPFVRAVQDAIERNEWPVCESSFEKRCTLAQDSPGWIGGNYFKFKDPEKGVRGHSTQTILSCRCLDYNCRHAIVMQPRLIRNMDKIACLYPRIAGKWRDCHTEILRPTQRDMEDLPQYVKEAEPYHVVPGDGGYWEAQGNRRHNTLEDNENLEKYETINFGDVISDFEKAFKQGRRGDFFIFGNDTRGDNTDLDTFIMDDDNEECGKIYAYARRSADTLGALQDHHAIGSDRSSYMTSRPEKVSPTDAFLAVGAAFAGLFTAIGIWANMRGNLYEEGKKQRARIKWYKLWAKLALLALVIPAEIGVLVFAFEEHNSETSWRSFFAWFDGSVTLPSSVEQCTSEMYRTFSCSAKGGIYISVALLGTVGYYHPTKGRWWSMLVMLILITTAVLVIVFSVVYKFITFIIARRQDPRFSGDELLDEATRDLE